MKKQLASIWLALVALVFVSGCATNVYNKEELSKPGSRFAIVSFGGLTSGLGMSESEDLKMITALDNVVYKELGQSKHFRLVTPSAVKASRTYALIKGEPTDGMYTLKVARGYKKFDPRKEADNLAKLMDELHLDGVLLVTAYYGKKERSAFVSGLVKLPFVSGGVANGHVTYTVVAYNRKNEVIWQDSVEATTQESAIMVMGIANMAKIYPQLVDITQEASRMVLKDLDANVGKSG